MPRLAQRLSFLRDTQTSDSARRYTGKTLCKCLIGYKAYIERCMEKRKVYSAIIDQSLWLPPASTALFIC